jgi:hypothetical protein
MTIPDLKVEIGFDLTQSNIAPFFTLDNAIRGVLDNDEYFLGGEVFYDITDRVRNVNVQRGRSGLFQEFPSGAATIELNNHDRAFDPVYPDSPFFGNIIPRRKIRVSSGGEFTFVGFVTDWNLEYLPNDDSIATALCNDDLGFLNGIVLPDLVTTSTFTGERINAILDLAEVGWPAAERDIDTGLSLVGTQAVEDGTNALTYLQKVSETEPGLFFMSADGKLTFKEKLRPINVDTAVNFSTISGISFSNIQVTYGAELLYNEITVANEGGGTVVVQDLNSQAAYGKSAYSVTDLLGASDQQAADYGVEFVQTYSNPQYRVEGLEIALQKLSLEEQAEVLSLDIGSVGKIEFTPNGIGTPIVRYGEVNQITHTVEVDSHYVNLKFREITQAAFTLNSDVFGTLDDINVLGSEFNPWTLNDEIYGRLSAGMALQ